MKQRIAHYKQHTPEYKDPATNPLLTHQLDNGLRLVHQHADSPVSYLAIMVNAGSRDEKDTEQGMAHFIEHAFFKGTTKRSALQIINRIEEVGGDLNAYTTKEETCVYATFLSTYYSRVLELLADIVFNSKFPEKELAKEREIIVDEINSYKDSPSDLIYDLFENQMFGTCSLGHDILGTPKHVRKFGEPAIRQFIQNNYHTDQIVVCSMGNIKFERLKHLFVENFSTIPQNLRQQVRTVPTLSTFEKTLKKNTHQSHCIIGSEGYAANDDKRIALLLLNNILGGAGMNSRLNLALREKNGYSYSVESSYNLYTDTGVVAIYFGCDKENLNKCIDLTHSELNKLINIKLSSAALLRAKNQITGQIAISNENRESLMLNLAKSYLLYNKVDPISEFFKRLNQLSCTDLLNAANDTFAKEKLSMLIIQ